MIRIEMNLNFEDLQEAIDQLPVRDRVKLVDHLMKDEETWRQQFRQVMRHIDARVKKHPISQSEIDQAVEEARQEVYDKSRR